MHANLKLALEALYIPIHDSCMSIIAIISHSASKHELQPICTIQLFACVTPIVQDCQQTNVPHCIFKACTVQCSDAVLCVHHHIVGAWIPLSMASSILIFLRNPFPLFFSLHYINFSLVFRHLNEIDIAGQSLSVALFMDVQFKFRPQWIVWL